MFILPCVVSAQSGEILEYRVVEDPGQQLFSPQNLSLAIKLAFDSEQFNESWPRYGYPYNAVSHGLTTLCRSEIRNRNINIGRSAIARLASSDPDSGESDSEVLMALPIENDTNHQVVIDFLRELYPSNQQQTLNLEYNNSAEDFSPVTIDRICGIIPDDSNDALNSAVIVTQRPLPIPERHSYRLLPYGSVADSARVGSIEQSGETAQ